LQNSNEAIFLFDTGDGTRHQITSGYYNDTLPTFDPDGKYLYYLSDRSLSPLYSDLDATWIYPNTTRIAAVPLRKDVPSPLAERSDEEEVKDEKEEEPEKDEKTDASGESTEEVEAEDQDKPEEEGGVEGKDQGKEKGESEAPKDVEIDLAGFEQRVVILPLDAGNYGPPRAVSGKLVYSRMPRSGSSGEKRPILFYDLKDRKENVILEDAGSFEITADGKQMLVSANRNRDYFYDPHMHGLDWDGLRTQYASVLEDAVTRWDVNFVIGELIGEINASHTYVGGGDVQSPQRLQTGLLGIDWELGDGAYRIKRIVRGAQWDAEARSPLAEPGIDVSEGDYILAVDGKPLDISRDPFAAFEGKANQTVALTINDSAAVEG
jgi:tricorn protease